MTDNFEDFKKSLIADNEKKYGAEIREKYGDREVDESNAKLQSMTQEQFDEAERLRIAIDDALSAAFETGDPASDLAQTACDLHRQWLCLYYPKYSKDYHLGLGEMYVADERFSAYYDRIAPGCSAFLRDAIKIYCN